MLFSPSQRSNIDLGGFISSAADFGLTFWFPPLDCLLANLENA